MKSKLIRLIHMPAGTPQASDFGLEETDLPLMNKGQLTLGPLYISVDPYLRVAMAGGHPPNINAGDIMISRGIAEVVNSAYHDFRKGDIVSFAEGRKQLRKWLDGGKLKYKETIVKGFEQLPQAFIDLFSGKNEGKMLVQL